MVSMRGYGQFWLSHECSEENYRRYRVRYQQPVEERKGPTICSKPVSSFTFFTQGRSALSAVPQSARSQPHKARPSTGGKWACFVSIPPMHRGLLSESWIKVT